MTQWAIIDNSALRNLYLLGQVPMLHLIYDRVLIPKAVEKEFLSISDNAQKTERFDFLMNFYQDNFSWFMPCNDYDQSIMAILQQIGNMGAGESEVISQNKYLGDIHHVIIDERIARSHAKQQSQSVCGVLSILARLDLQFSTINYYQAVQFLQQNYQARYSPKIITEAYQKIKNELNL